MVVAPCLTMKPQPDWSSVTEQSVCVCGTMMWTPPPPPPLICREIPVLLVSGEFPGNNAFQELPYGVLHCEDAVSIQLVVVFPCFWNRSQDTVCPVFGNITVAEAYLIISAQFSPVLFSLLGQGQSIRTCRVTFLCKVHSNFLNSAIPFFYIS